MKQPYRVIVTNGPTAYLYTKKGALTLCRRLLEAGTEAFVQELGEDGQWHRIT